MTISVDTAAVLGYLLTSTRILAWLVLVPPFAGRNVPIQAKVVIALGLALAATPADPSTVPTDGIGIMTEMLLQVGIGLGLGFVAMMLLSAISAAGSLIDVFGGFALSTAYDPLAMQMNTVFGKFYGMLATMLLLASGGHLLLIGGLVKTFEFLPLGDLPDLGAATPSGLIEAFSTFFIIAVQLALPMIAVLIIADVGLALLTKVSPTLNAITFLFPAKIGLVLMLVGLSFPMLPAASERIVDLVNQATFAFVGGGG